MMPDNAQESITGVLLMDMGGPADLDGVQAYIAAMLGDPDVVQLPGGFVYQKALARFLARKRAAKVRQRYQLIGGGSPILKHSRVLAETLQSLLDLPVSIAMRYTDPQPPQAIAELIKQGVRRVLVVPLFPHKSRVSTGSALKAIQRAMPDAMPWTAIEDHHDNPGYIAALAQAAALELQKCGAAATTHILFTAHSIPESYTRRGDPYIAMITATARLVHQHLDTEIPWSLAFQSAVGPMKWHGPDVNAELPRRVAAGVRDLVVIPLSFVSDNLETLYDLDIVLKQACETSGVMMRRVAAAGVLPGYAPALANLINEKITQWE